jgi:hypothetical protein
MRRFSMVASLLLAGCVTPPSSTEHVWTVDQAFQHAAKLDGRTILVRGWLPRCGGLDCTLYSSKTAADRFWENRGHNRILSIGAAPEFDRVIRSQVPAEIVLRARVNADCLRKNEIRNPDGTIDIILCADRTDDLIPLQIISVRRAVPSLKQLART